MKWLRSGWHHELACTIWAAHCCCCYRSLLLKGSSAPPRSVPLHVPGRP